METSKESVTQTWIFIIILALSFLLYSLFCYKVIGDAGQPTWDYRPVQDVPGESPYSMYQLLPHPQHVRGEKGE